MRFFLTDRGLDVVSEPRTSGVFMASRARAPGPTEGRVDAMSRRKTRRSQGVGLCAATLVLAAAAAVSAQSLSAPTFTNNSNPDEIVAGTATTPSRERETAVNFTSSSSGAFTTHFTSLVTTDSDGASASAGVE